MSPVVTYSFFFCNLGNIYVDKILEKVAIVILLLFIRFVFIRHPSIFEYCQCLKWKIINICFVLILIDTTTFCNHHVSLLSYQMTGKFSSRDIAAIFSDISNKHPVVECPLQICLTMSPQLTEYRVNIFSMLSLL